MANKFLKYLGVWLSIFLTASVFAISDGIPNKPEPPRLVNNLSVEYPDFFSVEETGILEKKLSDFAANSSNQIVIVVVDDLQGMEPWSYATELGQKWGVGQGKDDNGIVILIKPTNDDIGRKAHIAVGYGLESVIPDLTANRIVEKEIIPYLKQGQYFKAMDNATNILMALAQGEYDHKVYDKSGKKKTRLIFYIILAIFILVLLFGRNNGGGMTIGRRGTYFGPMFGGGGWGGFGGGGSGGGGGGFGGFGGGGFGGGGSGGSW